MLKGGLLFGSPFFITYICVTIKKNMGIITMELMSILSYSKKLIMPAAIIMLSLHACDQAKEIGRMESNTHALIAEKGVLLKTKKVLEFNSNELYMTVVNDSVLKSHLRDSLNIKDKDIKQLTTLVSTYKADIKAPIRDTSFIRLPGDTVKVYAKTFTHQSKHLDVSGVIYPDTVELSYKHTDNISLVIHYTKKGKWFLPRLFEKAKLAASVVNSDPYNDILIDKVIIKK